MNLVLNQTVPPTVMGIVLGPTEGLTGFIDVLWSDGPITSEEIEDVTPCDETGEPL